MKLEWIPCNPLIDEALQRLKDHFPKPKEPPPEAWFISGEINYLNWVIETPPEEMALSDLKWYLHDSLSGLRNFPMVEMGVERWTYTYHYLMPRLLERSHEEYLLSELIKFFVQLYPDTIPDTYPGFRADVLQTLGCALMQPPFWGDNDLSREFVAREQQSYLLFGSEDFIFTLSSALIFCLKYLTPSEIETWCESLFQIEGRHWHYNFMMWLYKSTFTLYYFVDNDAIDPGTDFSEWVPSTDISPDIVKFPAENMQTFIQMLKKHHIYYGE